jgi:hypothetical protein
MAALDSTVFDAMLKEYYADREILNSMIRKHPFFDRLKKVEVEGDSYIVPVEHAFPGGRSHDAATAFAAATQYGSVSKKFVVTTVANYEEISITNTVMLQSRSNRGAWGRARMRETNNMMKRLVKDISRDVWRDAGATVGVINGDPGTGTTITLASATDIYNFNIGDLIEFYSAATGGSVRAGGTRTVSGINRATGVVTVSAAMDAAVADGDYIALDGDYDSGASGVGSWITTGSPGALFGVTRTTDPEALSGHKFTDTSVPLVDQSLLAAERCVEAGANPDSLSMWLNNRQFTQFVREVGAKTTYRDTSDARVGRKSLRVDTSAGDLEVIADADCPLNTGYVLDMSEFELIHMDPVPHLWEADGRAALRSTTADQINVRAAAYYQLVCWNPLYNAAFSLDTTGL